MIRMLPGVLAATGGIVGILVVGAIAFSGRESIPEPEAPFGGISEGQPDQFFTAPAGKSVSTENASALPRAVPPVGMTGQEDGAATASYAAIVDDRKIVRSAALRAQVSNVADAFAQVGRMAVAAGGFVADASFREDEKRQTATVTVRVPANRFDELLQQVRGVSTKIDSETAKANDVTGEYSDLGARLRALEAAEGQLLQLLAQARNVGEVLQVQDRLNTVRVDIERTKGRMLLIENLSDVATITVSLVPATAVATTEGTGILRAITSAWASSLALLSEGMAAVLTVLVFSWWIIAAGVPAGWGLRRWLRLRRGMALSRIADGTPTQ